MNKLITKAQDLSKKAAEIKQVVQSLPGQAAKLREAVTMTGNELQQLRFDVESSIHALRGESEDHLLNTMRTISDHTEVFKEAGYHLEGMDLDLALSHRLAVHLDKLEDVPVAVLRGILTKQKSDIIQSIVSGIIKAEETSANVELGHLDSVGLIIHAGATPAIRVCWREKKLVERAKTTVSQTQPATVAPPPPPGPALGSMFEPRAIPAPVRVVSSAPAAEPIQAPVAVPPASSPVSAPVSSGWSHDALERFKKMPGVSKYGGRP